MIANYTIQPMIVQRNLFLPFNIPSNQQFACVQGGCKGKVVSELTSPVCVPTSSTLASSDSCREFILNPEPIPSLVLGADPPRWSHKYTCNTKACSALDCCSLRDCYCAISRSASAVAGSSVFCNGVEYWRRAKVQSNSAKQMC